MANISSNSDMVLGRQISVHSEKEGFPELTDIDIAIVGIADARGAGREDCSQELYYIRKELYRLYVGNWKKRIADLGDVKPGATVQDTFFVVANTVEYLLKNNIIPIILGGSQDITYANYRAYDNLVQTVNLAAIDSRFDIGTSEHDL